jgi:hypothetical protein
LSIRWVFGFPIFIFTFSSSPPRLPPGWLRVSQ